MSLVLVIIGCGAPVDQHAPGRASLPVVNGSDDSSHPAVVALTDASGKSTCSGTLITDHAVLTAAHCGIRRENVEHARVFFGANTSEGGELLEIIDAEAHPAYAEGDASHDLAIVLLAEKAPAKAVPLMVSPLDGLPSPIVAELVAYGATGIDAGDSGRRRHGQALVHAIEPSEFVMHPDPALSCTGDSGGAVLVGDGGDQVLAGVISRGDSQCSEYSRAARVDADQGFIQAYLANVAPRTADVGESCFYDEQCVTGTCVEALDAPRIRYCSRPCAGQPDCVAGMQCDGAGLCRFPVPTPGAFGSSCDEHGDCVGLECTDTGICSQRCVADGRDDCPAGYTCVRTGGINFFCIPAPASATSGAEGGCSLDAKSPPPWWHGVGLLACLTLLWGRRARQSAQQLDR